MSDDPNRRGDATIGVLAATSAFVLWGLTPVLWKAVGHIQPGELLAHRVLWCGVLLLPILASPATRTAVRKILGQGSTRAALFASTALIGGNWFLFIYAVNTERVMEASLGYYINPLVNVLLGTVFLGERLRRLQWVSVGLAAIGVATLTIHVGAPPWIALGLAFSFGTYGLLRKKVAATPTQGVAIETWILAPLAIGFLAWRASTGEAALGNADVATHALLFTTGIITAVPLILFAAGARRLDYSTVGILQYFAPTLQFLLAVVVYGEPFGTERLLSFALIWTAVAVYCVDALARWRRPRG